MTKGAHETLAGVGFMGVGHPRAGERVAHFEMRREGLLEREGVGGPGDLERFRPCMV